MALVRFWLAFGSVLARFGVLGSVSARFRLGFGSVSARFRFGFGSVLVRFRLGFGSLSALL